MKLKKVLGEIGMVVTILLCVFFNACLSSNATPQNKVAIIIDGSGSFKARQEEAVKKAISLMEGMAATKLHRWEPASDRITIISLDAIPEVMWEGTLKDLKGVEHGTWKRRLLARSDYAGCTDVVAAFRLAVEKIEGDSRLVSKYVLAFTDLIHQPPMDSMSRARDARSLPPDDFPWESLKGVVVSVFWVPADQKLVWRRAADSHGLGPNFSLYTTSESSSVKIFPPPRPVFTVTAAEREADSQRFIGMGKSILKALVGVFMGGLALVVLLVLISYLRRKRQGR